MWPDEAETSRDLPPWVEEALLSHFREIHLSAVQHVLEAPEKHHQGKSRGKMPSLTGGGVKLRSEQTRCGPSRVHAGVYESLRSGDVNTLRRFQAFNKVFILIHSH